MEGDRAPADFTIDPVSGVVSADIAVVVFGRPALATLADPAAAVADARTWSDRVGVFDEDRERLRSFRESVGVEPDFVTGAAGLQRSLGLLAQRTPGNRYVFVGLDDGDRETVQGVGWEYLPVADAAPAAGWHIE